MESFQHVWASSPKEFLGLRNKLYDSATQAYTSAITSKQPAQPTKNSTHDLLDSFYTDRKYRGKNSRGVHQGNSNAGGSKRCWIFNKDRCHSSKPPRHECQNRRGQLLSYFSEVLESSDEAEFDNINKEADNEDSTSYASSLLTSVLTAPYLICKGANPAHVHDFTGTALNTCCTRYCSISKSQYMAYCQFTRQKPQIIPEIATYSTSSEP